SNSILISIVTQHVAVSSIADQSINAAQSCAWFRYVIYPLPVDLRRLDINANENLSCFRTLDVSLVKLCTAQTPLPNTPKGTLYLTFFRLFLAKPQQWLTTRFSFPLSFFFALRLNRGHKAWNNLKIARSARRERT